MTETSHTAQASGGGADASPRVEAPQITLPKGGGAIRAVAEKYGLNPVTGTGSLSVPVPTSPGRSGFGPQLALTYDSGTGNGPFGLGWSLGGESIVRKTDMGLPRYADAKDSDIYTLAGSEDLVPQLVQANGAWVQDETTRSVYGQTYRIRRYRPRVEAGCARIERWTNTADAEDCFWRTISPSNITSWYGRTAESRVYDPADGARIFTWYLSERYDSRGNVVSYRYKAEDSAGIDATTPEERNRSDLSRSAKRYPKHIFYGNRTPYLPDLTSAGAVAMPTDFCFEIVFDYGEHDPADPHSGDAGTWACRPDPYSTYRPTFEVRSYRLCRRVLMFHHFEKEANVGLDCLVRSTDFTYAPAPTDPSAPAFSILTSVGQTGYRRDGIGGYVAQSQPPAEFEYSAADIDETVRDVDTANLENLPEGANGVRYRWVDLDGEGLQGILTEQGGNWFYKANLSPANQQAVDRIIQTAPCFAAGHRVLQRPSTAVLRDPSQRLMDLSGDGQLDLVDLSPSLPGFFERTEEQGWRDFQAFERLPRIDWNDPRLRMIDLTGDGLPDVLVTEDRAFHWHESLGEEGYGAERRVEQAYDEEKGPKLIFSDGTETIFIADMSGDGLPDLTRVRNGEVCYWPNLGYGRFGAKVTMDASPRFDRPEAYDTRRIRLADIDGSGAADVIYFADHGVDLYFNRSGNGFGAARRLAHYPAVDSRSSAAVVDLLGNGTACLVWSSPLAANGRRPMRYIDLMGGLKPHLLVRTRNNSGLETAIRYAPSTKFYVADRLAGTPWITRLPFPMHVVEQVETYDYVNRNLFVSRYSYHHGYFDGAEREFRGFGRVEQWDTASFGTLSAGGGFPAAVNIDAASNVPPVWTRTWYHTGAYFGADRISRHMAEEYYGEGDTSEGFAGLTEEQRAAMRLPDTNLPQSVLLPDGSRIPFDPAADELREAARALRGTMLRQEVYGLDGSDDEDRPYTVTEQNITVERLQPRGGNPYSVFMTHARERISFQYDRKLYKVSGGQIADPAAPPPARSAADPRVTHDLTFEVDAFGNILSSGSVSYGRRYQDPALAPEARAAQSAILGGCAANSFTNAIDLPDIWRVPLLAEALSYELVQIAPAVQVADITDLFGFGELHAIVQGLADGAHDLPHDTLSPPGLTAGQPYRRLLRISRSYWRPDDLGAAAGDARTLLPLRTLQSQAFAGASYGLTTTDALIASVYQRGGAPLQPAPAGVLTSLTGDGGGFTDLDGDGRYWMPSGRAFHLAGTPDPVAELAQAKAHFFLPRRFEGIFGQASTVAHDPYDLYVVSTVDAKGNSASGLFDYRVLSPWQLTDANANQSAVAFDALGMVVASVVMGKNGEGLGDRLDGFVLEPLQSDIDALADAADPLTLAAPLLGAATTRVVYDATRFYRSRLAAADDPSQWLPAYSVLLTRERHVSDLAQGAMSPIQLSFSYSDGSGREIQRKIPAEPGPVTPGGPVVDPRWVGDGWTVYNNKGAKVRQYEPFFSRLAKGQQFEFAFTTGVSDILCYDASGRIVAKIHADHSYEKVVFDPWRQESWDTNDTVLQADPTQDPDIGDHFRRLPAADYAPGWKAQRDGGAMGAQEQAASAKAAAHAATPALCYLDSMGRSFLTIADNGAGGKYPCRVVLDVQGQQRAVIDALGRTVMQSTYDLSGQRIHQSGMDAGARWLLKDALGNTIRAWDDRGHVMRAAFDDLRRCTGQFVQGTDVAHSDPRTLAGEVQIEQMVYGEGATDDRKLNLRTRLYSRADAAGLTQNVVADPVSGSTVGFDFKGNPLGSSRRFVQDHRLLPDWSKPAPVLGDTSINTYAYDALDRVVSTRTPDGSVVHPIYGKVGMLVQLDVNVQGAASATTFVGNIDYDVKGRRQSVAYGSRSAPLAVTTYDYDPLTFRLTSLTTTRPGQPAAQQTVQALAYTYDPGGRIVHIADTAQQTVFFKNRMVEPSADYTYDPLYRLTEATGREQLGLAAGAPSAPQPTSYSDVPRVGLPHPGDGNAMGRYRERYAYDDAGNLLQMAHAGSDPANPGWTRVFTYGEASLLEAGKVNNRLSSFQTGGGAAPVEPYSYDPHGNMVLMPQLQAVQWDFRDQMATSQRQAVGSDDADGTAHAGERTWYVYNATGVRVRKVTENANGVKRKERIYLGALEIYREYDTGGGVTLERQTLRVMDDTRTVALVETKTGDASAVRYQFDNQLGSASLELDETGALITYEEYYPYGSTSYQAGRSAAETSLKRYRFSGRERDEESGLYYHGARYYAPWLARWTSSDPVGLAGGTNFYLYCRCDPINRHDPGGTQDEDNTGVTGNTAVGITIGTGGIRVGQFSVAPLTPPYVVAFGRSDINFMGSAEANTGLTAINIQDTVTLLRQRALGRPLLLPGMPFFPDGADMGVWANVFRDTTHPSGNLSPMFSGALTQQALEVGPASVLHFDMRGVDLTPPLAPGTQPGTSPQDFHASSEARQAVAHLASTDPGERAVDIVIQHEDGVTAIPRDSNMVQGAPLPQRLADRMPNITNTPAPPPPAGNPGTGTPPASGGSSTGTGNTGSPSAGTGATTEEPGGTPPSGGASSSSSSGSRSSGRSGTGGGMGTGGGGMGQSVMGGVGRMMPGVNELESGLTGLAFWSLRFSWTQGWSGSLMTAAEATPVVAGMGVVGAGAGLGVRAGLEKLGVDDTTATTVGFGAAIATGAALGTFIPIPGVGTATGAVIGGLVAGALYLFSIW